METIDIMLVDDQVLFIESLKFIIEKKAEDIRILGIAGSGRQALEMLETISPEILLLDVRMPEPDGVEVARIVHQDYPSLKTIMLTSFDDDQYVVQALKYGGVSGYLLKDMPPDDLIEAIRAIHRGTVLFSPSIARKMVLQIETKSEPDTKIPTILHSLSEKEIAILRLISKGLSNRRIAEQINFSEQTVKNYVSAIYAKIGARNRTQAASMFMGKTEGEKE